MRPRTRPIFGKLRADVDAVSPTRNGFTRTANSGGTRLSARAMYDLGDCGPVVYNGKVHIMCFRANGSPYYPAM